MSTTEKPKVLLLGKIDHAHNAWAALSQHADLISPKASNRAEFIAECKSGALDGVVAAYRTFASVAVTGLIDSDLLDVLPKSLKFICHNGAGYDQVDTSACTAHSVLVSNVPTAANDATADTTMFLLLGALRNFPASMATLRSGKWRGSPSIALGHDPRGKVLGILGMGGIGRNVANKARAFGMEIRYYNRNKLDEEQAEGAEYVNFETLLKESDVLSLNLPLNASLPCSSSLDFFALLPSWLTKSQPHTRHTISTAEFAIMKPGIVIINTARGAVMDEAALVAALESGQVASAGLDVYENEPEIHPGLVANDNVLLVPHMGTWTVETQTAMEEWAISNVDKAIKESKLRSIVPEQRSLE